MLAGKQCYNLATLMRPVIIEHTRQQRTAEQNNNVHFNHVCMHFSPTSGETHPGQCMTWLPFIVLCMHTIIPHAV